ncbi:MAG: hypothetical protein EXR99_14635 [Gemmataceae bacterium]|nr:hypothetical protein [Gemmataceae bacterium]
MLLALCRFLILLALLSLGLPGLAQEFSEEEMAAAERSFLMKMGFPADSASLASYLREKGKGNPTAEDLKKTFTLLQSVDPNEYRLGLARVASHGLSARPGLRALESAAEGERKKRLLSALEAIGPDGNRIDVAAIRVLSLDSPALALAVLLDSYPELEEGMVLETARSALSRLCWKEGVFHPLLLKSLEDPVKKRRQVALEMLALAGRRAPREILLKKLSETDPGVQFLAASALTRQLDPRGFLALMELLPVLDEKTALEAEDLLLEIAGDLAPANLLKRETLPGKNSSAWKSWWEKLSGPVLLKELKDRIPNAANHEQIKKLIKELGDDQFEIREKAAEVLKTLGPQVVPALRSLADAKDVEVRGRAKTLLAELGETGIKPIQQSLPKLLVLKAPEGAVAGLLDYLPAAENDDQASLFYEALGALAWQNSNKLAAQPGLQDPNPRKRVGSGVLLLNQESKENKKMMSPLLKDSDPWVRYRISLFMALAGERDSLPILIQSLGELPAEQCVDGEGLLFDLAGNDPPKALSVNSTERKKIAAVWETWWNENSKKVVLDSLAGFNQSAYSGNVLIISLANNTVFELSKDGKISWSITGLSGPMDAQVLPSGRVLIAEHHAQRVTERNLKGEIIWKKDLGNNPISARKIRGGFTSVICRNRIIELDRQGVEVFSLARPQSDVMSAERLRDGSYMIVSNQMTCIKVDRSGKETLQYRLPFGVAGNANEFTREGNLIIPLTWHNKLQEYDTAGQIVMDATITQPVTVLKLPNRNYLVSTQTLPPKLLEIDRTGKQVGERQAMHPVFRVRYR